MRSVLDPLDSIQYVQHNFATTVARFAPSGYYIASGDESGVVKIWDCVGEDLILKGEYSVISGRINDIAWDADSSRIIAVGDGKERYGHCFTWDSGNTVGEISGHAAQINAVLIKPNRPYRAATVADDGALVFYQGPPFKFQQSVRGHHTGNFVRDVLYSASGEWLVSVGADRKIVVYDGKSGEFVKEVLTNHSGGLYGICWVDSSKVVTCSADASVELIDIEKEEVVKSWQLPKSVANQQLGIVVTEEFYISLSYSGDLHYFTTESDSPVKVIAGHQKSITALCYDGTNLYSGSYDGRISQWDIKTGLASDIATSESVLTHSNLIVAINSLESGEIITAAWDDTVKKISGNTFKASSNIDEQPKMLASSGSISVISTSDKLIVFDNAALTKTKDVKLPFEPTSALSVSSKYVIIGTTTNDVYVYDAESFSELKKLPPMTSRPTFAAISPNEEFVAVGDAMGKIVLYNLSSFTVQTSRWSFHTSRITSLAWNKDNDHVLSGSLDTNLIVYSAAKPSRNIKMLNLHKEGVNGVCWLGETRFLSGGVDSCIKVWDVEFS